MKQTMPPKSTNREVHVTSYYMSRRMHRIGRGQASMHLKVAMVDCLYLTAVKDKGGTKTANATTRKDAPR